MVKMTQQVEFAKAFEIGGYKEIRRTSKCITFSRDNETFFYLENNGSLRMGETFSTSLPVSETMKQRMLKLAANFI